MDWGLKNRLSRIIKPADNRAVMLAVDHGYFLGPTERLEVPKQTIRPLLKYCDSLMLTRGILRTSVDSSYPVPIVLRVSGGSSIIGEDLSNEEIIKVIEKFFEVGKNKDLAPLREIQLDDSRFSSFSDVPPFDLKDFATTLVLEELRFVSISDYDYQIKNLKISIFDTTAIVAFELIQKGILVDNKAFTGELITINGRATFVLVKSPTWKIAHIHLSKKE